MFTSADLGTKSIGACQRALASLALAYAALLPSIWQGGSLSECALVFAALAVAVLLPGAFVYTLVARAFEPLPLFTALALGFGFGIAIHVLLALAEGVSGLRGLVVFSGLGSALGLLWMRRLNRLRPPAPPAAISAPLALACAFAFSVIVATFFLAAPSSQHSTPYLPYGDLPWHLGNIHSARLGFPLSDFRIFGETLDYHVWIYLHLGSIANLSGADPEMLLLAYFPCYAAAMLVLGSLGVAQALGVCGIVTPGRFLPLVPFVVLLSGELDFSRSYDHIFGSFHLINLGRSPTYALSLVALFPTLAWILLGAGRVRSTRPRPLQIAATIVPLALLLFLCAGSKGSLLPLFVPASMLAVVVAAVSRQGNMAAYWCAVGLASTAALLASIAWLYGGGVPGETRLEFFRYGEILRILGPAYSSELFSGIGIVPRAAILALFLLGGLNIKLLGLRAVFPLESNTAFLAGIFFSALGVLSFISLSNFSQGYFFIYSAPITGLLLWILLARCASFRVLPVGSDRGGSSAVKGRAMTYVVIALIGVSVLDPVIDVFGYAARANPATESTSPSKIDADFMRAVEWIREHTSRDDVILANIGGQSDAGHFFNISGYGGRQVYLEGWLYTAKATDAVGGTAPADVVFGPQFAKMEEIFLEGRSDAAIELREKGAARWMFIDANYPCHPNIKERFPSSASFGRYSILKL